MTKRTIFDLPGEVDTVDALGDILKKYGLEESLDDFFEKLENDEEPKEIVLRDAALALAQKRAPEEKIVELLQKHLRTTPEVSNKIVADLKEKIIPYFRVVDLEQLEKTLKEEAERRMKNRSLQEELAEAIEEGISFEELQKEKEKQKLNPLVKKAETKNVEENAEKIQTQKKFGLEEKTKILEEERLKREREERLKNQPRRSDSYRESAEE